MRRDYGRDIHRPAFGKYEFLRGIAHPLAFHQRGVVKFKEDCLAITEYGLTACVSLVVHSGYFDIIISEWIVM